MLRTHLAFTDTDRAAEHVQAGAEGDKAVAGDGRRYVSFHIISEIRPLEGDGVEDVEVIEEVEGQLAPAAKEVEEAVQLREKAASAWAGCFAMSEGRDVGPDEVRGIQGEKIVEVACHSRESG